MEKERLFGTHQNWRQRPLSVDRHQKDNRGVTKWWPPVGSCGRDEQVVIANHATTTCQLILAFLLVHIDPSPGERLAVGCVEGSQIDFPHADAKFDGHQGAQKLAAGTWMERGRRQLVISVELLFVDNGVETPSAAMWSMSIPTERLIFVAPFSDLSFWFYV